MQKWKVLVVHCEPDFLKTAREVLGCRCEVSGASTRKEGLKRMNREVFDLIILGLLQPRGDAFRLYSELQENPVTKSIPLLIVDVGREERVRKAGQAEKGIQLGVGERISQPVDPAHLAETVQWVLEKAESKPMELKDALQQMERSLQQVDQIRKMLDREL